MIATQEDMPANTLEKWLRPKKKEAIQQNMKNKKLNKAQKRQGKREGISFSFICLFYSLFFFFLKNRIKL